MTAFLGTSKFYNNTEFVLYREGQGPQKTSQARILCVRASQAISKGRKTLGSHWLKIDLHIYAQPKKWCIYVLFTLILFTNDNDTYMHVIAKFFLTSQIILKKEKFVSKSLDSFSMAISYPFFWNFIFLFFTCQFKKYDIF